MEHINAFFAARRGQALYYPAEFEATELDVDGKNTRHHSWKIENTQRSEFQKAVIADGFKPFRFNGYFI